MLDDLAARVRSTVQSHGADGVAMYLASGSAFDSTGRRAAERFLRVLGSAQKYTATTIDTPSKPLVAEMIGGWSGLTSVWDHQRSTLLVLIGSNPVVSHGHSNAMPDPVSRLRDHRARGGEVWVIDPRATETARLADRHLAPRPGSDWLVLAHVMRSLLADLDPSASVALHERAAGGHELAGALARCTPDVVSAGTGLATSDLDDLVAAVRRHGRVSALTGTGVSMAATANVAEWMLWALHIVTDSYDQPGGMWFNPGYLLQLDTRTLPSSDGRSEPGPSSRPKLRVASASGRAPHSSVRSRPATERADVPWLLDGYQLAVATQFTPAVVEPVSDRWPMWRMFAGLGERLGLDVLGRGLTADTATDELLIRAIAATSRGGADAVLAARNGVIHSGAVFGWVRDVLPSGRWQLAPALLSAQLAGCMPPPLSPFLLIAHRQLRTMNSQLRNLAEVAIHVHPDATAELGGDGAHVEVSSAHGSVRGTVRGDERMPPGAVTIPHGWDSPNASDLTSADKDIDPLTGMVTQSAIPIEINPVTER